MKKTHSEPDPELAAALHLELKRLRDHVAPDTLLPRVMEVVHARARRPWWQQAWWQWPATAQATFLLVALAIVAGVNGSGLWLGEHIPVESVWVDDPVITVPAWMDNFSALGSGVGLLWRKMGQPLLWGSLILLGSLYLICVAGGSLVFQVATGRAWNRRKTTRSRHLNALFV